MFPLYKGKDQAKMLIRSREGYSTTVYADTEGNLTVGIGHLVTRADGLKYGDVISASKVNELFESDFAKAWSTTARQLSELGIDNVDFNAALASANFQLGDFKFKFPRAFAALKNRQFLVALSEINGTLWERQTPTRVADLTGAIRLMMIGV